MKSSCNNNSMPCLFKILLVWHHHVSLLIFVSFKMKVKVKLPQNVTMLSICNVVWKRNTRLELVFPLFQVRWLWILPLFMSDSLLRVSLWFCDSFWQWVDIKVSGWGCETSYWIWRKYLLPLNVSMLLYIAYFCFCWYRPTHHFL